MKKITLSWLLLAILFANKTKAQSDSVFIFNTYKNNISIGYDFKKIRKLRKQKTSNGLGPIHIKYEQALTKNIGIGAVSYFHYSNESHRFNDITFINGEHLNYIVTISGFSIIPKINWHFDMSRFKNKNIQKFDIYLGLGLGYGYEYSKTDFLMKDEGENNSYIYTPEYAEDRIEKIHFLASEVNLGARFYATQHLGIYFEFGYGVSRTQFGLIYKW